MDNHLDQSTKLGGAVVVRKAMRKISQVTLLVRDYDEAIRFFTQALRFELLEDTPLAGGKRWVRMAPSSTAGMALLLAKAATAKQERAVGNQTGGRVFMFLHTDNFHQDYEHMMSHGVCFTEEPRHEPYGIVVVFLDLYRNKWDLIGPVTPS
jgi:catechol 2,3-dioxygenase-like lactoylglutathione lyase family enzyme